MQGDFSRWTFDAGARFRSVLLQQGRALLDADWNEQAQITAHHDEARALDTFGRAGVPMAGNAFAIVDARTGKPPEVSAWEDLRIVPGRMYVDGLLVEAHGEAQGIPLGSQPDLPALAGDAALAEPAVDQSYAFILGVRTHHVTFDEESRLLESALGGPDTSTRTRTVWQVTWRDTKSACTHYHNEPNWQLPEQGRMAVSFKQPPAAGTPCELTGLTDYTRLENQLYRVQIHEKDTNFLWSRENGSVTAALLGIGTAQLPPGVDAELSVDRVGRDEELSIRDGDVVEITSAARQLRRKPGYLARVVRPDGLRLPVRWLSGGGVTDLKALGSTPIVRRWEGEPLPLTEKRELEGGIHVEFQLPAGGELETGAYWLVPARSTRLALGLNPAKGGLDASLSKGNSTGFLVPHGPDRHATPLAILKRTTVAGAGRWTQTSDCRRLAPSLTRLTTIDLIGGDGQEALPGKELPEPIRVVVRNGQVPVPGARILFTPGAGTVRDVDGPFTADRKYALTDTDGVAAAWWTPNPAISDTTQILRVRRIDDVERPQDVEVIVTGRVSKAEDVGWTPPVGCETFKDTKTVQAALDGLVKARELRLLGGDGQHLTSSQGTVLPKRVRVIVDSPCGPVAGAVVTATATEGALVRAATPSETRPTTLAGAAETAVAETEADGSAAFWWQPRFGQDGADTLTVSLEGDATRAPIVVGAQRAPEGDGEGHTHETGFHVTGVWLYEPWQPLPNDEPVPLSALVRGIAVTVDGPVDQRSFTGDEYEKPVGRILLDIPWPLPGEGPQPEREPKPQQGPQPERRPQPPQGPYGFRSTRLAGTWRVEPDERRRGHSRLLWQPSLPLEEWLSWVLTRLGEMELPRHLDGRIQLDGWAVLGEECTPLNGHTPAYLDGSRTVFRHPSDDAVTGGRFDQWFRLVIE
ncbi:DUF6519 domain-containing protein [Streptomyces sp. NPDC007325]|uniref:DUF6519 domain-containing protein n=1 Tax=Streptomyces sp. NPDC007325 TaxID=3154588 RepID=UPI00340AFFEB